MVHIKSTNQMEHLFEMEMVDVVYLHFPNHRYGDEYELQLVVVSRDHSNVD
jgi:hypothetical protein